MRAQKCTFCIFEWIEFRKNEVLVSSLQIHRDTQLELEYNLMLFRLGNSRQSSKIQERHINNIENNISNQTFGSMIKLADQMKEALLKGKVKNFADLLHESWLLKQTMNRNVTNDYVNDCYNMARKLGALGGKLLGAGGSGYLLIYSSPLYQKKIIESLADKGVMKETFKFSQDGLEVWSTKK